MQLSMLIWRGGGEGQAKARDLNSKQFLASNALPLGHHTWSKENKFTTPPTRQEAKYVSRVRKYAKIVQMTPLMLRRGVTLTPEIFSNKQGATLTPEIFDYKHSFVLTFFATNTIYINCKRCKP